MGKEKGKTHATPASSSRSNALNFGSMDFGGFSTSNLLTEDFSTLDAEIQVILKKLSKKDSLTRSKALEDLNKKLHAENIGLFIPVWGPLFVKFANDVDRKVRENVFIIQLKLVKINSKLLAPILKSICGTWLVSRFDMSRDVRALAFQTFDISFKNMRKVLIFCHSDIVDFITTTILDQTPEKMSDARYTSPEDMMSKYCQAIAGSFDTLSFLLEQLDHTARNEQSYNLLFANKQFWMFASHKESMIRASVYRFIKQCCQLDLQIIQDSFANVSIYYLERVFDDNSPSIHPFLWDSVLLLTKEFPLMWIDNKAGLKLCKFLGQGVYGSGRVSYPCILPLIGHIPSKVIDNQEFYASFVNSFWNGGLVLDRCNSQVFIDSYFESLLYLARKYAGFLECFESGLIQPIRALIKNKLGKLTRETILRTSTSKYCFLYSIPEISCCIQTIEGSIVELLIEGLTEQHEYLKEWIILLHKNAQEIKLPSIVGFSNRIMNTVFERLLPEISVPGYEESSLELLLNFIYLEFDLARPTIEVGLNLLSARCQDNLGEINLLVGFLKHVIGKHELLKLGRVVWIKLVEMIILRDRDDQILLFHRIMGNIYTVEDVSTVFASIPAFEDFVFNLISDPNASPALIELFFFCMTGNFKLSQKLQLKITGKSNHIFLECLQSILMVEDKNLFSFSEELIKSAITLLKIYGLALKKCSTLAQDIISENYMCLQQLAHCSPYSVSDIRFDLSDPKLLESLSVAVLDILDISSSLTINAARFKNFVQQFIANYNNPDNVGGPEEYTTIIENLESLAYQNNISIMDDIIQSQSFWIDQSKEFFKDLHCSIAIAKPVCFWIESNLVNDNSIPYDHEGFSMYARWSLLLLNFVKSKSIITHKWHYIELVRFAIACEDNMHLKSSVFKSRSAFNTKSVMKDVKEIIFNNQSAEELYDELLNEVQCQNGPGLMCIAFEQVLHRTRSIDARVLGMLLKETSLITSSRVVDLIIESYNRGHYFAVVCLISSIPQSFKIPTRLDELYNLILKDILITNRSIHFENFGSHLSQVVILAQFLDGVRMSNIECNLWTSVEKILLRWIRTQYDNTVTKSPTHRNDYTYYLTVFDSQIALVLAFIVDYASKEGLPLTLNMIKFIVELCIYWFKQLSLSEMTADILIMTYSNLILWETLLNAIDFNHKNWVLVSDARSDVSKIILDLFVRAAQPDVVVSKGIELLQSKLGQLVAENDFDIIARDIMQKEKFIYSILHTQNVTAQKTAYNMLKYITSRRVEEQSLAVELKTSDPIKKIGFADELILYLRLSIECRFIETFDLFGLGLSWLLILNHFVDSTFDLRQIYVAELRELNALPILLLKIFELLNIGNRKDEFALAQWSVDEYYVEGFEVDSESSIPLLFAHLYYRTLQTIPSLVRMWFSECNNRQLIIAVERFTEIYYSPQLIKKECLSIQLISDKDLSVRINPNTHEITAAYMFEDSELDMSIKLPSCFPLKLTEISTGTAGGRQAGINEGRWRAWLLSVTSVLLGQNGSIVDALQLFKKNVALHFEGIEDCAICFSY